MICDQIRTVHKPNIPHHQILVITLLLIDTRCDFFHDSPEFMPLAIVFL